MVYKPPYQQGVHGVHCEQRNTCSLPAGMPVLKQQTVPEILYAYVGCEGRTQDREVPLTVGKIGKFRPLPKPIRLLDSVHLARSLGEKKKK